MEPTVTIETVTPAKAVKYLQNNPNYRRLRPHRVDVYAKAMAEGGRQMTGEPIQFNGSALINGQHRLSACVQADASFQTVVVRGVEHDAVVHIDTGLTRSLADVLRTEGVAAYQANLGAVARIIIGWRRDMLRDFAAMNKTITREELIDFVLTNQDELLLAIRLGDKMRQRIGGSRACFAAVLFEAGTVDPDFRDAFAESLITGEGLVKGDPVLALRTWITSSTSNRTRRSNVDYVAVFAKAWNAWISGSQIAIVKRLPSEDPQHLISPN